MSCENLVSELDNLQQTVLLEFMFNYVYKYSECALLGVLDRDKLLNPPADSDKKQFKYNNPADSDKKQFKYNKNGIQRIMYIMEIDEKSAFEKLTEPKNLSDDRANSGDIEKAAIDMVIKFREYVEKFVEEAFNDVEGVEKGCGTAFIKEYKKVQAKYEELHNLVEGEVTVAAGGRMKGGRMKGGDWWGNNSQTSEERETNSKRKVAAYKYIMWTILLLFLFYVIGGSPAMIQHVLTGFTSIANGECNNAAHFIFGRFGIQHPFCTAYRELVNTLFNAFFKQDPQALLILCVNLSQVLIAPTFAFLTIDVFICTIGQLFPLLSDAEKNLLQQDMAQSITIMAASRDAIVVTLTNLLNTFRTIVNGSHARPLQIGQDVPSSKSAQGLVAVGRGGGGFSTPRQNPPGQRQQIRRRIAAAASAAVAATISATTGPLSAPRASARASAARGENGEEEDRYGYNSEEDRYGGGKKSRRRRRRRGRKSKKR